jgi:glycosyltransferase involved in cell wall biosynthesis
MISIIIPVYNAQKYLSQCLDSVLNQEFKDFECICVNDGSTDKSQEILEKYRKKDGRIKIILQKNAGISAARNAGVYEALGEYVYFMDNDDFITKDYLENMHKAAIETKCPMVVNPNINIYFDDNDIEKEADYFKEKIYRTTPYFLLGPELHIFVWNKLFKTALIRDVGLNFPLNTNSEDVYFYYCIMPYIKNFAVSKKGVYYWRQTKRQASRNVYFRDKLDYIDIFNLIKDYYIGRGLDKNWQIPIYYLRQQLFRMPQGYNIKEVYEKIKDCLNGVIIHKDVLRQPEQKFIRDMNKGYAYIFLMYYFRKKLKNKIKSFFNKDIK